MGLTKTTPAASAVLDADDIYPHIRLTAEADEYGTNYQTIIDEYIAEATEWCENELGISPLNTTWTETFDNWSPTSVGELWLSRAPVSSVTSISYYDSNGDVQTWSSAEYQLVKDCKPAIILPAPGYNYPGIQSSRRNAVTVTYVAGYGTSSSSVPEQIKQYIRQMVISRFLYPDAAVMPESKAAYSLRTHLKEYGW